MLTRLTSLHLYDRCASLAGLGIMLFAMWLPASTVAASDWFNSKADSSRFGDWFVLCDESLTCEAYAEEFEGSRNGLFSLSRRAGDQGWMVSISLSGPRPDLAYGIQMGVVDEVEHVVAGEVSLRRGELIPGTVTSYYILPEGAAVERVVERLRADPANGVRFPLMYIDFPDCSGVEEITLSFPLAGVTEALAWIDDKQNRPAGDSRLATTVNDLGTAVPADCID